MVKCFALRNVARASPIIIRQIYAPHRSILLRAIANIERTANLWILNTNFETQTVVLFAAQDSGPQALPFLLKSDEEYGKLWPQRIHVGFDTPITGVPPYSTPPSTSLSMRTRYRCRYTILAPICIILVRFLSIFGLPNILISRADTRRFFVDETSCRLDRIRRDWGAFFLSPNDGWSARPISRLILRLTGSQLVL
jgi:hypothetical protein